MKIILITAVIILLAIFIIPTKSSVSRSIDIYAPKQAVFDYVKQIKNQERYSVWVMEDPNIKMTYTGNDGTIGFTSAWDSQISNVGAGSQTITEITDNSYTVDLQFIRPFVGQNTATTSVEEVLVNDSDYVTRVTTIFYSESPRPKNVMSLVGNYMIGKATQQNLGNLKAILEK